MMKARIEAKLDEKDTVKDNDGMDDDPIPPALSLSLTRPFLFTPETMIIRDYASLIAAAFAVVASFRSVSPSPLPTRNLQSDKLVIPSRFFFIKNETKIDTM